MKEITPAPIHNNVLQKIKEGWWGGGGGQGVMMEVRSP